MSRQVLFAAATLALVACGGAGSSSEVSVAIPAPSATAPVGQPALRRAILIWLAGGSSGGPRTLLVGDDGAVLAERDEPVVATKAGLFALRRVESEIVHCDCEGSVGPFPAGRAVVEELKEGGAVIELGTPIEVSESCDVPTMDVERGLQVMALAGTAVFARVHDSVMFCSAAHPTFGTTTIALDLASGHPLGLGLDEPVVASLRERAHEVFTSEYAGCIFDPEETPQLYDTRVHFDQSGKMGARLTFTVGAPYMCGTGPGHYSVETDVDTAIAPSGVPRADLPGWARAATKDSELVGVGLELDAETAWRAAEVLKSASFPDR